MENRLDSPSCTPRWSPLWTSTRPFSYNPSVRCSPSPPMLPSTRPTVCFWQRKESLSQLIWENQKIFMKRANEKELILKNWFKSPLMSFNALSSKELQEWVKRYLNCGILSMKREEKKNAKLLIRVSKCSTIEKSMSSKMKRYWKRKKMIISCLKKRKSLNCMSLLKNDYRKKAKKDKSLKIFKHMTLW